LQRKVHLVEAKIDKFCLMLTDIGGGYHQKQVIIWVFWSLNVSFLSRLHLAGQKKRRLEWAASSDENETSTRFEHVTYNQ